MALLTVAACDGEVETTTPTDEGQGGQGPTDTLEPKEFYLELVHPELVQSCAICHQSDEDCTPQFMAAIGEDSYAALRAYRGLVTYADNSNLIHHGAHTGPALTATQESLVREWLALERPGEPDGISQLEALEEFGACMRLEDFESTGVDKFAYQQTKYGPCGSCHKTGEAGTWIGYNTEEMFTKNTELPWIKRLVRPIFDADGDFVGLESSSRFVEKVEFANQCGTGHAPALVPAQLEQSLVDYFELTDTRWKAGACDDTVPVGREEDPEQGESP